MIQTVAHRNRNFVPSAAISALLRTVSAAPKERLFNLHPRSVIDQAHHNGWIEPSGDGWQITDLGIVAMEIEHG